MLKGPGDYDITANKGMNELFSPQYATSSQWCKESCTYKGLNIQVERDLVKYNRDGTMASDLNRDDTMPSDLYKDYQRKADVYTEWKYYFIITEQNCTECIS